MMSSEASHLAASAKPDAVAQASGSIGSSSSSGGSTNRSRRALVVQAGGHAHTTTPSSPTTKPTTALPQHTLNSGRMTAAAAAISATAQGRTVFLPKHAAASPGRTQTSSSSSQTVVAAVANDEDSGSEHGSPGLRQEASMAGATARGATAPASGRPPEGGGGGQAAVARALAGGRSSPGPNANGSPGAGASSDYASILSAYYDDYQPTDRAESAVPKHNNNTAASSSSHAPQPLQPLRLSTYKSEPTMHTLRTSPEAEPGAGAGSYSQMLENALFYSQAIRQIRENDTVDAGHPYAAAVPRTRPGKEDIRQRRARNVVASREVFSITTASTFIPIRSAGAEGGLAGPRVMRSEPTFMEQAPARRVAGGKIVMQQPQAGGSGSSSNGSSSSSAVPMSRLRPKPGAAAEARSPPDAEDVEEPRGWEAGRRAGCDQPPEASDGRDDGVKQRSVEPAASPGTRNRLSAVSHGSSSLSSAMDIAGSFRRHNMGSRHRHQHANALTAQSRRVAMRLLVRAGLSRIAIRVARLGSDASDPGDAADGSFDAQAAVEAAELDAGVDVDPNGLQKLQAARRQQVERVDCFGFMHFRDEDAAGAEQAQAFAAWAAQHPARQSSASAAHALAPPDGEMRWATLLAAFDSTMLRGSRKIKQLVQAGMPAGVRARAYYLFSGARALERPGEYARLLELDAQPIFDVIERDVGRSYPDHVLFALPTGLGQQQLRRMLRAYAQYDPQTGYCQGMGRLAGLLLIVGMAEEQAFWVLCALVREYVPQYYAADLSGLRTHTAVFDRLLADRHPRLHAHLAAQGCDALMYATPWFMTLFTLSLPWPTALRVWDWFVYRGSKVLFRVALAIMDLAAPFLLDRCPTIAELLGFLLHLPPALVEPDALVAAAVRVRVDERRIGKLTQVVEREQQQR